MEREDNSGRMPLYLQIAARLLQEIEGQGWDAHAKLPSEVDLAERFRVSRGTVTKALDTLVDRRLLYRRRPRGTFVSPPPDPPRSDSVPGQGHAGLIGVVVGGITEALLDSVHGSILFGVQTVGRAAGFGIMLAMAENDVAMERYYIEDLCERGVEGLIVFPGSHPVASDHGRLESVGDDARSDVLRWMQERGTPFVLVDRWVPSVHCDWVVSDDEAAGRMATDHLIGLGHRRIGFLTTKPYVTGIANRLIGYSLSMQAHGLAVDNDLICHVHELSREGHMRERLQDSAGLQGFLRTSKRPTAFIVSNDYVAARLTFDAEAVGLRVPDDLAIVSCGWGGSLGAYARVPLTTIAQPLVEVGRQATHVLLDRMAGRSSLIRHMSLPVSLVVRESCGARKRATALAARPSGSEDGETVRV
jgi:DNA-binding LacI/PurR family transcriptional regulator